MKKLKYIQQHIKNEQELCILIDYNDIIKEFEESYEPDLLSPRYIRILKNFSKCDFINIYILIDKDTPKKNIKKLSNKLEDITFIENINIFIEAIKSNQNKNCLLLYLGNQNAICEFIKNKAGISIAIKTTEKTPADILLSRQKFEEILLETNNICLA